MPLIAPSSEHAAAPYAIAAQLLDELPANLKAARTARGMSAAAAAKAIGVTTATLTGLEGGSNCTRATATAVLTWLAS